MSRNKPNDAVKPWMEFGYRLRPQAVSLITTPGLMVKVGPIQQPATFAAALLARTIGHFKGALLVAKADLITEAKTLVRSEFENVLWLRSLVAKGEAFIKEIKEDHQVADISYARVMLEIREAFDKEDLHFMAQLASTSTKKLSRIQPSDTAKIEDAFPDYAMYKSLSGEAAHPSLRALSIHLPDNPKTGDPILTIEAPFTQWEMAKTVHLACGAMLHAMGLFKDVVPSDHAQAVINMMVPEYLALEAKTGVARGDI